MIKFVDLSEILEPEKEYFAFYNTETHHFIAYFNRQVWESEKDFLYSLEAEKDKDSTIDVKELIAQVTPKFKKF